MIGLQCVLWLMGSSASGFGERNTFKQGEEAEMQRIVFLVIGALLAIGSVLPGCAPAALTIFSITEGDVLVMKAGTDDWTDAAVGMSLGVGDIIKTGDNSGAEITFFDGSTIELGAGTQIEITALDSSPDTDATIITLLQTIGTTISRVTKILDPASRYEVETPSGVVAVRGSAAETHVTEDGTTWGCNLGGDVWTAAQDVELQVPEGRCFIIRTGHPPELAWKLAISSTSGGEVITPREGTFAYEEGTVVNLVAEPDESYQFVEWTGDVDTIADVNAATTTITINGRYDITAHFRWSNIAITQVAAGGYHTVGLKGDGTVVALGDNSEGQCDVGGWTDIIQVAAGTEHTVGLKSDGTVVAVGRNLRGECNVDGWTDITQIAAGPIDTVGFKSDGTVVAVGRRASGQAWTDITDVAVGNLHMVGLKSDGTVIATGDNSAGQCNIDSWTDITQVAAGPLHTVGLKDDGTVVAVGWNYAGMCDDVVAWTDIVQVSANIGGLYRGHNVGLKSDGTVVAVGDNSEGQCDVDGWTGITQVAAGEEHTVGLKSDGTVVAVGDNEFGQCNVGD